jgi:hypothetical protein
MFHYLVTIERGTQGRPYYTQTLIARVSPPSALEAFKASTGAMNREMRRQWRKYPDARSIEVQALEASEYQRRKDFENRHETALVEQYWKDEGRN